MYKILINESGVLKLVEVPEKPEYCKEVEFEKIGRCDNVANFHGDRCDCHIASVEYSIALSAALADKSKYIAFKDDKDVYKFIFPKFYAEVRFKKIHDTEHRKDGMTLKWETDTGKFIEESVTNGQTFDLPENVSVSIIYQLKNVNGDWVDLPKRCEYPEDSTHRKLAILTPITEAPVKSEGEQNWTGRVRLNEYTEGNVKTNTLIQNILDNVPLRTKIKVANEMAFINLITELGYRENKAWDESDEADDKIYRKLMFLAQEHTIRLMQEIEPHLGD